MQYVAATISIIEKWLVLTFIYLVLFDWEIYGENLL